MSKKNDLKKAIAASEQEIASLEQKCARSQMSVLQAILDSTQPSKQDAQYFRTYSALIEVERENLRKLKAELESL